MSGQPPRIQLDNVSVDHSKTVVYKAPEKKTVVPPWAQQQLKSTAGGNTRTFKGGTTVVTKTSGPTIANKGPSITPKKVISGPVETVESATGATAPKRIVNQPHAQPQVAAAPVAYVPEQRLYKPKLDDKSFLKQNEDDTSAAPVLTKAPDPTPAPTEPNPPAAAAAAPPPAPAPEVTPTPPAPAPAPPAPPQTAPPGAGAGAGGAASGSGSGTGAGNGTGQGSGEGSGPATAAAPAPAAIPAADPVPPAATTNTAATTTTKTVTTTTVEQDGGCCIIL